MGRNERGADGPTKQRLTQADGYVAVGDDRQGTKIYQMFDSVLDRTYSALVKKSGSSDERLLLVEWAALRKYNEFTNVAGLDGSIRSIDFDQAGGGPGEGRSFLANSERQVHARNEIARAHDAMSVGQRKVVLAVVVADQSLILAGFAIGSKSQSAAHLRGQNVLRTAGETLARLWGLGK